MRAAELRGVVFFCPASGAMAPAVDQGGGGGGRKGLIIALCSRGDA